MRSSIALTDFPWISLVSVFRVLLGHCIRDKHRIEYRVLSLESPWTTRPFTSFRTSPQRLYLFGEPKQKGHRLVHELFIMTTPYPYTRSEECSWQPEEVARHLAALATSLSPSSFGSDTSSSATTSRIKTHTTSAATSTATSTTHLLSHGWSTRQISMLRERYGVNRMHGEKQNDDDSRGLDRFLPWVMPVITALMGQLKEPLILMLLGSAGLSIVLGNTADAISIGIALLIVSLVAAVQEYRSEAALEKLADLVPPTCTVLRDGRVIDDFLARDLVVGDLVLLATGE